MGVSHRTTRRAAPVPPDPAPPGPAPDRPGPERKRKPPSRANWLTAAALLAAAGVFVGATMLGHAGPTPKSLAYSDFVAKVEAGQVRTVTIDDHGAVAGTLLGAGDFTTQIPTALPDLQLSRELAAKNVQITAKQSSGSNLWGALLVTIAPLVLFVGAMLWLGRNAQRAVAGGVSFGKSKSRVIEKRPTTTFADIAGYDGVKQEISEIVDFLRDPGKYAAAGAKGLRGLLMVGPPGTGKTLLARAVAGEAGVRFLSVTGSEFVEMFVGVGASRVRDLFEQARREPPAIIFVDEIDAIGSRRGAGQFAGNDEREQTLNQLLAEMDGFDQSTGIVVLAATNRPEALDRALLRPGRFDRQVTVPLPNLAERAAILRVHVDGKTLAPGVDLSVVARATPGFSGADLSNLVNEAAIHAVRDDRTVITGDDLFAARDRVLLGRRDSSNALLPDERRAVAIHESGHAIVAALCPNADPVAKVTILPAGMSLGVTEQLPEVERHLYSEGYLLDLLAVRLGGRAAELVLLGEGSTGAADDLAGATQLAIRMVCEFGLSARLGPVGYSEGQTAGLETHGAAEHFTRPYSEQTQTTIDLEVARLLREAEERAVSMLREHTDALRHLAAQLLEHETVDGAAVLAALADRSTVAEQQPTLAATQ